MKQWNRDKTVFTVISVLCVLGLYGLISTEYTKPHSFSVGIIGGADGPTSIFVTTPGWTVYILPCVLLIVGIAGILWLRKCKK